MNEDFGWDLPPGVTDKDCEEAYMSDLKFTDDDLKRLKEDAYLPCIDPKAPILLSPRKAKALLARLGAAEALLDLWMQCDDDCEIDGSVFDKAMDEWRKSKGE